MSDGKVDGICVGRDNLGCQPFFVTLCAARNSMANPAMSTPPIDKRWVKRHRPQDKPSPARFATIQFAFTLFRDYAGGELVLHRTRASVARSCGARFKDFGSRTFRSLLRRADGAACRFGTGRMLSMHTVKSLLRGEIRSGSAQ